MKKLLMIAAIFSFTLGTTLAQDVPTKKGKREWKADSTGRQRGLVAMDKDVLSVIL
jgi:hypothetical protein